MNTGITVRRLPGDPVLVDSLPEGTTERDYPRYYCLMSYEQFLSLLPAHAKTTHKEP